MLLSKHAEIRCAQRGFPKDVVATILAFGSEKPAKGAVSLVLDKSAIELAVENNRHQIARLERYRGAYAITSGNRLITVAHGKRRFRT